MQTSDSLLRKFNELLIRREVRAGFALLDREGSRIGPLHPSDLGAGAWLLCMAQWIDLGCRSMAFLDELAEPFSGSPRAVMHLIDYLCLRLVDAYTAFIHENSAKACEIFDLVLRVGPGVLEQHLLVVTHFWKCRAHRQRGEYQPALHHIQEAKAISVKMESNVSLVPSTGFIDMLVSMGQQEYREA